MLKDKIAKFRNATKTSLTLRWRLRFYLFIFILAIFSTMVVFLLINDVFFQDKAIKDSLHLQNERYHHRLDTYFSDTAAQGIFFSQQVSASIEKTLAEQGALFEDVSDNQELITLLEKNTYDILYSNFLIADCSGAFIILNATVNTKLPNADNSRSGTYIQLVNLNTPKPVNPKVSWLRGAHVIGHDKNLVFNNSWELEFDISRMPFYHDVIKNAGLNLANSYYYSAAFASPEDHTKLMLLLVPLVGRNGEIYGVCGFEINSLFFRLLHAEVGQQERRIIGLVAQRTNDSVLLDSGFESASPKAYYAGLGKGVLSVSPKGDLNLYRLTGWHAKGEIRDFIGLETGISLAPLSNGAAWVAISMIPKEDYDKQIRSGYLRFALFCLAFFSIAIILIHYISKHYNSPILRGITAIKDGSLQKTNINEIDDLLDFLAQNDNTQADASPGETAQDVDMSAFYEFRDNVKKLSRAETAIFGLYMEGLSAPEVADKLFVSINTIKSHNKNIYRKLNISSRKELLVYAQMMKNVE